MKKCRLIEKISILSTVTKNNRVGPCFLRVNVINIRSGREKMDVTLTKIGCIWKMHGVGCSLQNSLSNQVFSDY